MLVVLMAAVVLAMLSTSLVTINRSGFLSLHQYEQRSLAMQACYAGLDYARARLVQVPGWSTLPYGTPPSILNEPAIQVDESGQTVEENLVSGKLLISGATFQVKVENNLTSNYRLPSPSWCRSQMSVAPRCALVSVDGQSGSVRRRIEVLLVRKTGVGGAIYAGGDLAISLSTSGPSKILNFSSTVPKSNLVKVNGTVRLPDPEQVDFSSNGGRGRLQSGADTIVNSTYTFSQGNVTNPQLGQGLSGNSSLTSAVAHEVKASITTNTPPAPPKFTPDQLKKPAGSPILNPGYYHFTDHETVEYRPTPTGSPTTYHKTIFQSGTYVELSEYRFMPQGNVQVNGDLHLSAEQTETTYNSNGSIASQKITDVPVTLAVGYDKLGLPLSYTALGTATKTKSRLTVNGNVEVEGDLIGSGQIFVQKDSSGDGGTMQVNGNSFLSATRTDGMALVAESVVFGEVDSKASTQYFAMLPNDFNLYAHVLDDQNDFSADVQKAFKNWQASGAADLQAAAGMLDMPPNKESLRSHLIGGDYNNVLNGMLPEGKTPGGKILSNIQVALEKPDPVTGVLTLEGVAADQLIADYVLACKAQGGMTLGLHTRLREFIKSLDRVSPNSDMINLWNPVAFTGQDPTIQTLVVNQVSAYNQDARTVGKRFLEYMDGSNPYQESQRRDFLFGGILYAKGNIYTNLASSFRLLGAMISEQGTVGFDHLNSGKVVFDPSSFEDQFDITKLGLGPAFFWIGP